MAENLIILLEKLKSIRTYLIKIGPARRTGDILVTKKEEAKCVLHEYNQYLEQLSKSELSKGQSSLLNKACEEIENLYAEIESLCKESISKEEQPSHSKLIMTSENFDLKIALNLLNKMNDETQNTKQLIEGIEYYDTVLTDKECKRKLVQFVLKSRLSERAKLAMLPDYQTVSDLVKDMRKLLLPRKGHTALQTKLQQCKQNDKSISDFGRELSELFVDLTISQAEGNTKNYNILRPLNEKMAIKKFADGLRNRRLSTIIASRNFNSLSEAIQSAQDEEVSGPGTSSMEVMGMYKHSYQSSRRVQRGRYIDRRGLRNSIYRGRSQHYGQVGYYQRPQMTSSSNDRFRGGFRSRGRFNGSRTRGFSTQKNSMNVITTDPIDSEKQSDNQSLAHFFRA